MEAAVSKAGNEPCPCMDDFHELCFVGDNDYICDCFGAVNDIPS